MSRRKLRHVKIRRLQSQHPAATNMETQMQSDLLDRDATCRFFGGTRPINPATLYRGVRKGRYPKPVKVGPGSSRWLRAECQAALDRLIDRRPAE